MSSTDEDDDGIDDDVFLQLVEYRKRFYENLANDSLRLLSIQLLVLPVSISVISLLIEVISKADSSGSVSPVEQVIRNVDYTLFRPGAIVGISSIILSVLIYYVSRKRASNAPNLILEKYHPEAIENGNGISSAISGIQNPSSNILYDRYGEYIDSKNYEQVAKSSFNESDDAFWRASFMLGLVGTLGSAGLIFLSFIKSVYEPATSVTIFLMRNAILLIEYSFIPVILVLFLEKMFHKGGTTLFLLTHATIDVFSVLMVKIKKLAIRAPIGSLLFVIYFFILVSGSVVLRGESRRLTGSIMAGGIFVGIVGVILLIKAASTADD